MAKNTGTSGVAEDVGNPGSTGGLKDPPKAPEHDANPDGTHPKPSYPTPLPSLRGEYEEKPRILNQRTAEGEAQAQARSGQAPVQEVKGQKAKPHEDNPPGTDVVRK